MSEDAPPPSRPKWVVWLLVGLPLWLVLSGGTAVWYHFQRQKQSVIEEQERFVKSVSESLLADDLRKITTVIGERNGSSEAAAKNLTRAAALIEGTLGPANTGYAVRRLQGPADWPLLHVTLPGKSAETPALWVLASYDSRPGSIGVEANATGLTATLAAAQAMAGDHPQTTVHFLFLPHANDPEAPILESIAQFRKLAGAPKAVLCVEAMGAESALWLSSRDSEAAPLGLAQGLGSVRGAETVCLGDDTDLSSLLCESGLPAVRVSTRAIVTEEEADAAPPPPAVLAASAGRLVELIRRCAAIR